MSNNQALESYFEKHCPELKVHFGFGDRGIDLMRSCWALELEVRPQDDPEMVKSLFLDELYKMIGIFTVVAQKMRDEPVLEGGR